MIGRRSVALYLVQHNATIIMPPCLDLHLRCVARKTWEKVTRMSTVPS